MRCIGCIGELSLELVSSSRAVSFSGDNRRKSQRNRHGLSSTARNSGIVAGKFLGFHQGLNMHISNVTRLSSKFKSDDVEYLVSGLTLLLAFNIDITQEKLYCKPACVIMFYRI